MPAGATGRPPTSSAPVHAGLPPGGVQSQAERLRRKHHGARRGSVYHSDATAALAVLLCHSVYLFS